MSKSSAKQTTDTISPTQDGVSEEVARSVYADFEIWTNKKTKPKWHPVRKMRYVFFRMISGVTITDALKEIRWSPSEFWHLIDLKRKDPFHEEYQRAKKLQGRAIADSVQMIAEGRDAATKRSMRRVKKLIAKHLNQAKKQKSPLAAKAIIESLLAQIDANDHKIVARNKVQIDAAKWLATKVNPGEFSEKTQLSLNGGSGEPDDSDKPILIQFVAPDGSVVTP